MREETFRARISQDVEGRERMESRDLNDECDLELG